MRCKKNQRTIMHSIYNKKYASCVLCQCSMETRYRLFFTFPYSAQVWEILVKGILEREFSTDWDILMGILKDHRHHRDKLLLLRYTFQATVYALWRERNSRTHGEAECPPYPCSWQRQWIRLLEIASAPSDFWETIATRAASFYGLQQETKE